MNRFETLGDALEAEYFYDEASFENKFTDGIKGAAKKVASAPGAAWDAYSKKFDELTLGSGRTAAVLTPAGLVKKKEDLKDIWWKLLYKVEDRDVRKKVNNIFEDMSRAGYSKDYFKKHPEALRRENEELDKLAAAFKYAASGKYLTAKHVKDLETIRRYYMTIGERIKEDKENRERKANKETKETGESSSEGYGWTAIKFAGAGLGVGAAVALTVAGIVALVKLFKKKGLTFDLEGLESVDVAKYGNLKITIIDSTDGDSNVTFTAGAAIKFLTGVITEDSIAISDKLQKEAAEFGVFFYDEVPAKDSFASLFNVVLKAIKTADKFKKGVPEEVTVTIIDKPLGVLVPKKAEVTEVKETAAESYMESAFAAKFVGKTAYAFLEAATTADTDTFLAGKKNFALGATAVPSENEIPEARALISKGKFYTENGDSEDPTVTGGDPDIELSEAFDALEAAIESL